MRKPRKGCQEWSAPKRDRLKLLDTPLLPRPQGIDEISHEFLSRTRHLPGFQHLLLPLRRCHDEFGCYVAECSDVGPFGVDQTGTGCVVWALDPEGAVAQQVEAEYAKE